MNRPLNDKEIEATYLDICEPETVIKISFKREDSGWVEISLPQNEKRNEEISKRADYEDDDLLDEEKSDSFIIYEHSGKIAFDSWYPEKVYFHIVKAILKEIREDPKSEAHRKALKTYAEILD